MRTTRTLEQLSQQFQDVYLSFYNRGLMSNAEYNNVVSKLIDYDYVAEKASNILNKEFYYLSRDTIKKYLLEDCTIQDLRDMDSLAESQLTTWGFIV